MTSATHPGEPGQGAVETEARKLSCVVYFTQREFHAERNFAHLFGCGCLSARQRRGYKI